MFFVKTVLFVLGVVVGIVESISNAVSERRRGFDKYGITGWVEKIFFGEEKFFLKICLLSLI